MQIKVIVGNRPQFIKAAALFRAHNPSANNMTIKLVHTGQHYDQNMSAIFFDEMDLPQPDWHLEVKETTHGKMTGKMMGALEEILLADATDYVLVFGDTNSTLAGALAAAKLNIPVAHIEAGLRSFNRKMPEEINRILTDHAADLLFTPTPHATAQLEKEGIDRSKVFQIGDVMLDAFLHYRSKAETDSQIRKSLGLSNEKYVLATVHRSENTADINRLSEIVSGLVKISAATPVVLPLHPRTRKVLDRHNISLSQANIHLIDPVGYLDMIALESHAEMILTDSGGVQKEAYFCQVPCITLRNETEWVELLELGVNQLVPAQSAQIVSAFRNMQEREFAWDTNLYGDGLAAEKVLQTVSHTFKNSSASAFLV